MNSSF